MTQYSQLMLSGLFFNNTCLIILVCTPMITPKKYIVYIPLTQILDMPLIEHEFICNDIHLIIIILLCTVSKLYCICKVSSIPSAHHHYSAGQKSNGKTIASRQCHLTDPSPSVRRCFIHVYQLTISTVAKIAATYGK